MAQQESWEKMEETEGLIMCSNNCGFFGSSATMNMCSKCYRDHVLNQTKASEIKAAVQKSFAVDSKLPGKTSVVFESSSSSSFSPNVVDEGKSEAVVSNRCHSCRKRVGLTGFKCRCENIFCSLHRYSENHDCSFDYKAAGRLNIEKANPVVKADKVQKI